MNRRSSFDRIVIFGNSGSGKTTFARKVCSERGLSHLDLDRLAWEQGPKRRALVASLTEIRAFIAAEPGWVVEGCYADLLEPVLPFATEVHFLNPGLEACLLNCCRRSWEPDKYGSAEEQIAGLPSLLEWVRQYESRADEYSLAAHRRLFQSFVGPKWEHGATA